MKIFIAALLAIGVAAPAAAQNKREMQMMADIRMLQEQNQQLQVELQAAIAALSETLKVINGRVDDQSAAMRKGFADQTLKIDQLASEQRVVREGVSENNVRISQLSQEVEAVRLSIPQFPPPGVPPVDPAADPGRGRASAPGAPAGARSATRRPGHVAAEALRHRPRGLLRRACGIRASTGSRPTSGRSRAASSPTRRSI